MKIMKFLTAALLLAAMLFCTSCSFAVVGKPTADGEFHWGLHTDGYYAYVNGVITACTSEAEVRQALNALKTEITIASVTGEITWTR